MPAIVYEGGKDLFPGPFTGCRDNRIRDKGFVEKIMGPRGKIREMH